MERSTSQSHSDATNIKHKPPPLSEAEQKERVRRLEAEHELYIKNIATMRHLPRLQSTIAGAGGKTNAMVRIAEEQERERLEKLHRAAQKLEEETAARAAHEAKVNRLEEIQSKKRAKQAAKKTRKKMKNEEHEVQIDGSLTMEGHDDNNNNTNSYSDKCTVAEERSNNSNNNNNDNVERSDIDREINQDDNINDDKSV